MHAHQQVMHEFNSDDEEEDDDEYTSDEEGESDENEGIGGHDAYGNGGHHLNGHLNYCSETENGECPQRLEWDDTSVPSNSSNKFV